MFCIPGNIASARIVTVSIATAGTHQAAIAYSVKSLVLPHSAFIKTSEYENKVAAYYGSSIRQIEGCCCDHTGV